MTPIPQTARYALRAMAYLAPRPRHERVPAEEIARVTHVPQAFLSKILRKLVAADLLTAERGHGGGFSLARPPETIRFLDVFDAVEVDMIQDECAFGWGLCNAARPCPLHPTWAELKQSMLAWAARRTLADISCEDIPPRRP